MPADSGSFTSVEIADRFTFCSKDWADLVVNDGVVDVRDVNHVSLPEVTAVNIVCDILSLTKHEFLGGEFCDCSLHNESLNL
jgi:hypothetical protein